MVARSSSPPTLPQTTRKRMGQSLTFLRCDLEDNAIATSPQVCRPVEIAFRVKYQRAIWDLAVAATGKMVQDSFFPTAAGVGELKYCAIVAGRRVPLRGAVELASGIHAEFGPWPGIAAGTWKSVNRAEAPAALPGRKAVNRAAMVRAVAFGCANEVARFIQEEARLGSYTVAHAEKIVEGSFGPTTFRTC
jgi:hypothetical protein